MFKKNLKMFWVSGALVTGVLLAAAAYLAVDLLPQRKPTGLLEAAQANLQPRVTKSTLVRVEYTYLCGNKESSEAKVTQDLIGLDLSQLTRRFSREDGWLVSGQLPTRLVLEKEEWDVCPVHRNFRHLGQADGYLAIFEGPLGVHTTLLQKEDIRIASLPRDLQEQLAKAGKFGKQSPKIQQQLRENLEFTGDEQINAFLDNLDEYREE
ncbi:MAG TPA: hypothetical protein VHS59_13710 [Bacillota bacterium]|nr:hypothetical protein [Bacillota bacterium]